MSSTSFYDQQSGSGSASFVNNSEWEVELFGRNDNGGIHDSSVNSDGLIVVLIILSPFILIFVGCVILNIISICDSIRNKHNKYINKVDDKIINGKLNKKFIKELNTCNRVNVDIRSRLDCAICIEEIKLETFKLNSNKLIFLNCSHIYHTKCMQNWVKSQIKEINKPTCPMCRDIIINIYPQKTIDYSSDSSNASEASYWND